MKCKLKVGKNWTIPFQSESYLIREREVFKDSAGFQKPRVAGSDCFVFDSGKGAARNSILKQEFFRSANKSIQHITSIPPTEINTVNNSANNLPFFCLLAIKMQFAKPEFRLLFNYYIMYFAFLVSTEQPLVSTIFWTKNYLSPYGISFEKVKGSFLCILKQSASKMKGFKMIQLS